MKEPDNITKGELPLNKTVDLKKLVGKNVLSKGGTVIGKISEIRVSRRNTELQGIIVKGKKLGNKMYIGKSYFSRLSHESVILNIEVSVLIKNKLVIDSQGKKLGIVKEVIRKDNRNDLKGLHVRSLLSKKFFIPQSAIDHVGNSVVLKSRYNARKKYFWQKNK